MDDNAGTDRDPEEAVASAAAENFRPPRHSNDSHALLRMNSQELMYLHRTSHGSHGDTENRDSKIDRSARPSTMRDGDRGSLKRGTTKGLDGAAKDEDEKMKAVFVDAAAMKERVRANLCKPAHKVTDFYKERGVWQAIAKSFIFENVTLSVIAFNALWISIDTDNNNAEILLTAHPVFQVAENFFCAYFTMEWIIRFMAFKRKRDGLRDRWFTFDSGMVLLMVLETWVMSIIVTVTGGASTSGGLGNASVLRVARLLRLSRMARMARLLRAMPELMILIKGMVAAMRSVFFTLFLLVIIMYVFAVAFTQLTSGSEVGKLYFDTVTDSMYTLLMYGTLLDDVGSLAARLGKESLFLGIIFFIFVLLGALTVMNMLIGVLCEVVSAVAATEREEMLVGYVNRKVRKIVEELDQDGGGTISKDEFVQILENMEAVKALQDVGVDVVGLVDFADVIFEEEEDLSFPKFMEVVLQLRGSNNATVKDVVDLRKLVRTETMRTNLILERLQNLIASQQVSVETAIQSGMTQMKKSEMFKHSHHSEDSHVQKSSCDRQRPSSEATSRSRSHHEKVESYEEDRTHSESRAHRHAQKKASQSSRSEKSAVQVDIESDCSPWPIRKSDNAELLRSSTEEDSFVDSIPVESEITKTDRLLEAQISDALSEFRGLWKPCDLAAVQVQAARQGDLKKILQTPVYWKALKNMPESLRPNETIELRLKAAHAILDAGGASIHQGDSARKQGHASTGALGCGVMSGSPIHLQTLHEQVARLSKVMVVGLGEVIKIQDELSQNGVRNARQDESPSKS